VPRRSDRCNGIPHEQGLDPPPTGELIFDHPIQGSAMLNRGGLSTSRKVPCYASRAVAVEDCRCGTDLAVPSGRLGWSAEGSGGSGPLRSSNGPVATSS